MSTGLRALQPRASQPCSRTDHGELSPPQDRAAPGPVVQPLRRACTSSRSWSPLAPPRPSQRPHAGREHVAGLAVQSVQRSSPHRSAPTPAPPPPSLSRSRRQPSERVAVEVTVVAIRTVRGPRSGSRRRVSGAARRLGTDTIDPGPTSTTDRTGQPPPSAVATRSADLARTISPASSGSTRDRRVRDGHRRYRPGDRPCCSRPTLPRRAPDYSPLRAPHDSPLRGVPTPSRPTRTAGAHPSARRRCRLGAGLSTPRGHRGRDPGCRPSAIRPLEFAPPLHRRRSGADPQPVLPTAPGRLQRRRRRCGGRRLLPVPTAARGGSLRSRRRCAGDLYTSSRAWCRSGRTFVSGLRLPVRRDRPPRGPTSPR